jgi:hypothetical protein
MAAQRTHLVGQGTLQRVAQVLRDAVHTNAAHGADGQGADERAGVARVLPHTGTRTYTHTHTHKHKHT